MLSDWDLAIIKTRVDDGYEGHEEGTERGDLRAALKHIDALAAENGRLRDALGKLATFHSRKTSHGHLVCSAWSNASDISTGPLFASGNSAQSASSYVLIAGASSVTASFIRV